MTEAIKDYVVFVGRCARQVIHGDWRYFLWVTALVCVSLLGLNAYLK